MLTTKINDINLGTPLLLASGHITENTDFYNKCGSYCAGIVTRSLKENPPPERKNTPAPRYVVFDNSHSMLNCEWGNNNPWTYWRDFGVDDVRKTNGAVIISLSGRDIASCCRLINEFDKLSVDAYEINISCSHSGALHGNLNINCDHLTELMTEVRKYTQTPIWIKLSYSSLLVEMAKAAEKLGADAIVCTNSIGPGMFIDIEAEEPKLGVKNGAGGVTGRAIFPIALNCVYQLAEAVRIPIIGSGGVSTYEDVIQMIMAGASAVQLYTEPALNGPEVFKTICDDLDDYLKHKGKSIKDLIGVAHGKCDKHNFKSKIAKIDPSACINCRRCKTICNFDAINEVCDNTNNNNFMAIETEKCTGCTACMAICPTCAIILQ